MPDHIDRSSTTTVQITVLNLVPIRGSENLLALADVEVLLDGVSIKAADHLHECFSGQNGVKQGAILDAHVQGQRGRQTTSGIGGSQVRSWPHGR
jgi:hypothetical protein